MSEDAFRRYLAAFVDRMPGSMVKGALSDALLREEQRALNIRETQAARIAERLAAGELDETVTRNRPAPRQPLTVTLSDDAGALLDPAIYRADGRVYNLNQHAWARRLCGMFPGLSLANAARFVVDRGYNGARDAIRRYATLEPVEGTFHARREGVTPLDGPLTAADLMRELAYIVHRDFNTEDIDHATNVVREMTQATKDSVARRECPVIYTGDGAPLTRRMDGVLPPNHIDTDPVPPTLDREENPPPSDLTGEDFHRPRAGGLELDGTRYTERQHASAILLTMHYAIGLVAALRWTKSHGTNHVEAAIDRRMTIRTFDGNEYTWRIPETENGLHPVANPAPGANAEPDTVMTRPRRRIVLQAAPIEEATDFRAVAEHYANAISYRAIPDTGTGRHVWYVYQRHGTDEDGEVIEQPIAGPFANTAEAEAWASKLRLI